MRKFTFPALLIGIVLFTGSFKSVNKKQQAENGGYFMAVLNGIMFEMRDKEKYTALVDKSENGKAVITSLIFYGNQFKDTYGKSFDEDIEFEYAFAEGITGEQKDVKIIMHYDLKTYYPVPGKAGFSITKMDWSADRRTYLIDGEFDCRMRRAGAPEEEPTIHVKGRMVNINVSVPPWIKIKESTQVAGANDEK